MSTFTERIVRAARLDIQLYEEVEADKEALGQATVVVVLSSIAGGLGSASALGLRGLILVAIASLVGWYIWAFLTHLIGTRLLPEAATEADLGQLLRTIGFSSAPGLIRIVGIIRPLAGVVALVAEVWMLVAMVIAVRQALDYTSTWRAIGVCLIGWIVQLIVLVLAASLLVGSA